MRVIKVGLRLFKEVGDDDLSGGASELAYKLFLALFPFMIFLTALGGFAANLFAVSNPTDEVMNLLGESLPEEASTLLREQVSSVVESRNAALLSIGIIGAIWAASSGVGTVIKTLNRVYEVSESRSLPKRYGLAVGLTLLAGGFMIGAFVLLFLGQIYGTDLAARIGLEGEASLLLTWGRWPVAIGLLLLAVAFLYWACPNVDLPFRWISPGAILFVASWLAATFLFSLYVANFGSYSQTYGALGGVVILLFWLYLTSFLLLLGAELNAVLAQTMAPRELAARSGDAVTASTAKGGGPKPEKPDSSPESRAPAWLQVGVAGVLAAIAALSVVTKGRLSHHEG